MHDCSPVDAGDAQLFLDDAPQLGIHHTQAVFSSILLEELLQVCEAARAHPLAQCFLHQKACEQPSGQLPHVGNFWWLTFAQFAVDQGCGSCQGINCALEFAERLQLHDLRTRQTVLSGLQVTDRLTATLREVLHLPSGHRPTIQNPSRGPVQRNQVVRFAHSANRPGGPPNQQLLLTSVSCILFSCRTLNSAKPAAVSNSSSILIVCSAPTIAFPCKQRAQPRTVQSRPAYLGLPLSWRSKAFAVVHKIAALVSPVESRLRLQM